MQTMADGTLRMVVDIEPRHAKDAFGLFGVPGTALALAALKTAAQQAQAEDARVEELARVREENAAAESVRVAAAAPKPAGGALSKLAGQWCQMPQFWAWCKASDGHEAASFVRQTCNVLTRAELDHDAAAAELFHTFIREPFSKYMQGAGG